MKGRQIMSDMSLNENSTQDIVNRYRQSVAVLAKFLPWLREHAKKDVSTKYDNSEMGHTIPFPVYDSTLLNFVKTAQGSGIMNRNYVYLYSKYHISGVQDELRIIEQADIMRMDDLRDILSRYILEGNVKGELWSEGVRSGVMERAVTKMQELIEFWDKQS